MSFSLVDRVCNFVVETNQRRTEYSLLQWLDLEGKNVCAQWT